MAERTRERMRAGVDHTGERVPPQALEAEVAVLGSILQEREALLKVLEVLGNRQDYFYKEAHQRIYASAISLFERNEPVDLVTLSHELSRRKELEEVGGASYLTSLVDAVPTAANVTYYARIVRDKAILRELIRAATDIVAAGYADREDVDEILDLAERRIFEISQDRVARSFIPLKNVLKGTFELIERMHGRKTLITGVPTGFREFDAKTAGLQPSDLIVIAGRPALGKTSFALNIAQHAAIVERLPVAIFSLEMSMEQVALRMLCSEARVDSNKVRTGYLSGERDWRPLIDAASRLSEAPIFIDDTPGISVLEMRAKARRLKAEHNLQLIIVDYLQLVQGRWRAENRQQEIAEICRSLKAMAKELNVPLVALSQLSRRAEEREEGRPQLADLRECLTGDTMVVHAETGERYAIRDLYERGVTIPILTLDRDWKLHKTLPAAVIQSGVRPVYRLRTAMGREIRASGNHPFLTIGGWVPLERLAAGVRIAVPRTLPVFGANGLSRERARLLGYLLSDGHCGRCRTVSFTNGDPTVIEDARQIVKREFGIPARLKPHWSGTSHLEFAVPGGYGPGRNPLANWLKSLGIHGQLGPEKQVPDALFQSPLEVIAVFLGGLYAGDGSIIRRVNRYVVKYSSTSLSLLHSLQSLLLQLGIIAVIQKPTRHAKSTMDITDLVVEGKEQVARFAQVVSIPGWKGERLWEALTWASGERVNHHIDRLPLPVTEAVHRRKEALGLSWTQLGYRCQGKEMDRATLGRIAVRLADEELFQLAQSDVLWDRVMGIEPDGEEMTYDLIVPGTHNFVANNLIVHNSGAIEQDADLVAFLYRPSLYRRKKDPTAPEDGTTEVIIAKQRNGPTGIVKLTFLREYARFEPAEEVYVEPS